MSIYALEWKLVYNPHARVEDLLIIIGLAISYGIIRYILDMVLYKPIARKCIQIRKLKDGEDDVYEDKITKFAVAFWYATVYSGSIFLACRVVYDSDWFFSTPHYWIGWPNLPLPPVLRWYYLLAVAYYIYSLFALYIEPHQKDFSQMLIHHIATVALILFSFYVGFFRVGIPVLLVHDVSDPLLQIGKLFFYSGKQTVADIIFALFAVVFILSRIVIYPYYLLYTTYFESKQFLEYVPFHREFNGFLFLLFILHLIWSATIIKMVYLAIRRGGVQGDDRDIVKQKKQKEQQYKQNGYENKNGNDKKYH